MLPKGPAKAGCSVLTVSLGFAIVSIKENSALHQAGCSVAQHQACRTWLTSTGSVPLARTALVRLSELQQQQCINHSDCWTW